MNIFKIYNKYTLYIYIYIYIFKNFIKCLCILRYTIWYDTRYRKIKNRFTIRFTFWQLWSYPYCYAVMKSPLTKEEAIKISRSLFTDAINISSSLYSLSTNKILRNYHCFLDWVGIGGLHIHFHSIAGMSVTAVLRCIVSYTLSSSSFFKLSFHL